MTELPLILQIQKLAIDESASLSSALRTTKVACAKLGLDEFSEWAELELKGYGGKIMTDVPGYRHIYGRAEVRAYGRWMEWQLSAEGTNFTDKQMQSSFSHVTVRDSVPHLEAALQQRGQMRFEHDDELLPLIEASLGRGVLTSISVSRHSIATVLQGVREVLVDWTIRLEKEGVTGQNLVFTDNEKVASQSPTQMTINNFQIGNVGALVQSALGSTVSGSIGADDEKKVRSFLDQCKPQIANLPQDVRGLIEADLKQLSADAKGGRITATGLSALSRTVQTLAGIPNSLSAVGIRAFIKSEFGIDAPT